MRGRSLQGLQVFRLLSRSNDMHRCIPHILPPKHAGILGVAYAIVRDFSAKRYQVQTREERIHALLVGNVGSSSNSSCSESPVFSLQDALQLEGATQEDVGSTIAVLCAAGDFERATASFVRVQALGGEKGIEDALSALIGDDTATQVLAAYTKQGRFAEARKLLPLLHRSREHLLPQCVSVLVQAYCAAGRLNMAEDMLSQWLHLALKHTQRLSASAAGGSVGAALDWDTILQQTLEGPVTSGRSAAFGPLHDTGPAIQLLAHMKDRRHAVALKAAEGSGESASPAAFASILQLAGPSVWSHFPDLGVWSSVAKMYASRNSHYECLLVLNLCVSGTVNTAMESAREMQAIYDSTVKVMCSSMQFRKAIAVHKQSINTHRLLTSELKHLSYLLRYMSELETVDEKILVCMQVMLDVCPVYIFTISLTLFHRSPPSCLTGAHR